MEDVFKPTNLTIQQLFGNTDALYQIPRYQRPYSWGAEQLSALWDDLHDAQMNEPNYFLGSIITAMPEDQSTSSYLDIVDGQQRITTLLILFCVIRDDYPELNMSVASVDPFAVVNASTVENSIRYNGQFERLRLRTHSNHESSFERFILAKGATKDLQEPSRRDLKRREEPEHKFINTACFFRERLSELSPEEVGEFVTYLFKKVNIIRIDCQSVSFAIKLFQVLNDRGLDLTNADLIKSFMIENLHRKYAGDGENRRLMENRFIDDWKSCESMATDTDNDLNEHLVLYEYFRLADNPKRSLYIELKNLFGDEDSNETIADIKRFIAAYKRSLFENEDPELYGFWYVRWSVYWRSVLMTAAHTEYREFEKLARVLRRYYYLNWIAGYTLSRVKQPTFNLIKAVKAGHDVSRIEADLESSMNENQTVARAIERLRGDIYRESWCKALLLMIEYNQHDKPTFIGYDDRSIHVEHILPRKYAANAEWAEFQDHDMAGERMNTGANLTLLSGSKNAAASNWGFARKMKAYDGTGLHERDDQKVTSFVITQQIVHDYKSGKHSSEWNAAAMDCRWEWFCWEVQKLFDIDIRYPEASLTSPVISQPGVDAQLAEVLV